MADACLADINHANQFNRQRKAVSPGTGFGYPLGVFNGS